MAGRFAGYNRLSQTLPVEGKVLFGDCKDVELNKLARAPTRPGPGSTISYEARHGIDAVPGRYRHGEVLLKADIKMSSRTVRRLHVAHHEDVDGAALGRWLCQVNGHHEDMRDNVINRYDWCHHRNWGGASEGKTVYLVAASAHGKRELGRIALDPKSCIEGEWHYGLRITDPSDGNRAYAFVFGDVLVNDLLSGNVDESNLESCRGFQVPRREFAASIVAASAEATPNMQLLGSLCRLRGLQEKQQLNGLLGHVRHYDGNSKQFVVDLVGRCPAPDCAGAEDDGSGVYASALLKELPQAGLEVQLENLEVVKTRLEQTREQVQELLAECGAGDICVLPDGVFGSDLGAENQSPMLISKPLTLVGRSGSVLNFRVQFQLPKPESEDATSPSSAGRLLLKRVQFRGPVVASCPGVAEVRFSDVKFDCSRERMSKEAALHLKDCTAGFRSRRKRKRASCRDSLGNYMYGASPWYGGLVLIDKCEVVGGKYGVHVDGVDADDIDLLVPPRTLLRDTELTHARAQGLLLSSQCAVVNVHVEHTGWGGARVRGALVGRGSANHIPPERRRSLWSAESNVDSCEDFREEVIYDSDYSEEEEVQEELYHGDRGLFRMHADYYDHRAFEFGAFSGGFDGDGHFAFGGSELSEDSNGDGLFGMNDDGYGHRAFRGGERFEDRPHQEYTFLREDGTTEFKAMGWIRSQGDLVKLCQGVYGLRSTWDGLSNEQRMTLQMGGQLDDFESSRW